MLRELDQRAGDGLTVTLTWDDDDNVIVLHIDDHGRTSVGPIANDRALDAFRHPFCYLQPVAVSEQLDPEPVDEPVADGDDTAKATA